MVIYLVRSHHMSLSFRVPPGCAVLLLLLPALYHLVGRGQLEGAVHGSDIVTNLETNKHLY